MRIKERKDCLVDFQEDVELQILVDYFEALQSPQRRLIMCLGFKAFRENRIQKYNG